MKIEVAYALPHQQRIFSLDVDEGTTAKEAVQQAGVDKVFPALDVETAKLGIFGKSVKANQVLQEGDRVEVYRPLLADPKEVRKKRAAKAKEASS
ncbi:hypothetical protein EDC56_3394 [Sinobacterium caligoides]|uniref:UPF0125 protein EDC56_3394 n=1 Tax=Sinobacterium caligoides TaxID=933926 RepID=A0A3N2DFU0_9GAMM|nr:RnfH family protein [Sinobacterium caligoides]ROR98662.1 hypothetical protein EDC56_3394 [Sinobacterium caligoides]